MTTDFCTDLRNRNNIEAEARANAQVGTPYYMFQVWGGVTTLSVVRKTKTQLILSNDVRINISTGSKVVANSWDKVVYCPDCPHVRERVAEIELRSAVKAKKSELESRLTDTYKRLGLTEQNNLNQKLAELLNQFYP